MLLKEDPHHVLNGGHEADDVERRVDGVGHGEDDADRSAQCRTQNAGHDVVGAASTDLAVGTDGRHGHGRHQSDERRYADDDERLPWKIAKQFRRSTVKKVFINYFKEKSITNELVTYSGEGDDP